MMQSATKKKAAVVLLSGGLDSATTLAIAQEAEFEIYAMSFRYGQRHLNELAKATEIAKDCDVVKHIIVDIDLAAFGGSALTDSRIDVPKSDTAENIGIGIPVTYVPARNTIFLSFALAWAETLRASDIFIGVNALDYSGYPDCRPEYIAAFETMASLATKVGVSGGERIRIHTPLIHWSKAQIIARGLELGVDYSKTLSCYDPTPEGQSCGHCDACLLRLRGFKQNDQVDPATYVG